MSINININSWIIEHTGTHEGYAYDKLQIKESSGHRLYLTTIKNGMRMNTMIKIMKLEEGKVYLSFNKKKIEIGTYKEVAA